MKTTAASSWDTKNLGWRIGVDCTAAASAGMLVAPVVTAIDRAIIENASGRTTLRNSLLTSLRTLLLRPHTYVFSRPFALIFTLYTGTYLSANTLDTTTSVLHSTPASTTTAGAPKFVATSTANLALCLYKDSRFTRMFGITTSTPRPVPSATYALFALRDCLTVFASFNVPPLLAPALASRIERTTGALGDALRKHVDAASTAQFVAPAAVQIFSTPLHLLGLDLYNRPRGSPGVGFAQRLSKVTSDWGMSCLARMARIVPAFGCGGVVNLRVRRELMGRLE
ncbi:putative membrane protein [Lasiodiplodia hormozganensis]|uniref:Membrane protein n=1 Tax=Lasiodiplodia hormozganensis TaxID=869390 RepID=A0AA40CT58_9PEZI|nr:putative membrane protein [Lasiodiplodia hormozganensis]